MRELTELEIERFDFTGHVPELSRSTGRQDGKSIAKNPKRNYAFKARVLQKRPSRKRHTRIGTTQTA